MLSTMPRRIASSATSCCDHWVIVGYCRRNFLVPMPRFRNFDDLNTHLEACCAKRWAEQLRGHDQTVGERLERDRAVLQRLPAIAYDACDKRPGRVSSLSLVRYRGTDYSVPTRFGHCEVLVRGYVHEVVISCAAEVIARHPRSYEQACLSGYHPHPLYVVCTHFPE